MLYNRPPMRTPQVPGYTTAIPNRQAIPAMTALGQPQLQTNPGGFAPGAGTPYGGGSAGGGLTSSTNVSQPTSSLSNTSIPNPSEQQQGGLQKPPSMSPYLQSSNQSTLLRALLGKTT